MSNQETIAWRSDITDAPLPPLVDPRDMAGAARLFVEQYRKLGPIFRLPQPGKPLTEYAPGKEAKVPLGEVRYLYFAGANLSLIVNLMREAQVLPA